MKNFIRSNMVSISVVILILIFLFFAISPYFMSSQKLLEKSIISINNKKISVEIADKPETWTRGLMFHEPLKENEGMLFLYGKEGNYGIWMPNMSFAIDIIWIDSTLNIIHIERNVQPCESMPCKSYRAEKLSLYVLEIKANSSIGMNIGDKVEISLNN